MSEIKDEDIAMKEQVNTKDDEKKPNLKRRSGTEDEDKPNNDKTVTKVDEFDGRRRTRSAARGLQSPAPAPAPTPIKNRRLSKTSPKTTSGRSLSKRQSSDNEKKEIEKTTKVEVHAKPIKLDTTPGASSKAKGDETNNENQPDDTKQNNTQDKKEPDTLEKDDKKALAAEKSCDKKDSPGEKDTPAKKGSGEITAPVKNAADKQAESGENTHVPSDEAVPNDNIVSGDKAASGDAVSITEKKPNNEDKSVAANGGTKTTDKASAVTIEKELAKVAE